MRLLRDPRSSHFAQRTGFYAGLWLAQRLHAIVCPALFVST